VRSPKVRNQSHISDGDGDGEGGGGSSRGRGGRDRDRDRERSQSYDSRGSGSYSGSSYSDSRSFSRSRSRSISPGPSELGLEDSHNSKPSEIEQSKDSQMSSDSRVSFAAPLTTAVGIGESKYGDSSKDRQFNNNKDGTGAGAGAGAGAGSARSNGYSHSGAYDKQKDKDKDKGSAPPMTARGPRTADAEAEAEAEAEAGAGAPPRTARDAPASTQQQQQQQRTFTTPAGAHTNVNQNTNSNAVHAQAASPTANSNAPAPAPVPAPSPAPAATDKAPVRRQNPGDQLQDAGAASQSHSQSQSQPSSLADPNHTRSQPLTQAQTESSRPVFVPKTVPPPAGTMPLGGTGINKQHHANTHTHAHAQAHAQSQSHGRSSFPEGAVMGAGAGADMEGVPASDYWHEKYAHASREILRLTSSIELIEQQLVASVDKESRVLAARYAETQVVRQAQQTLQQSISKAKALLKARGVDAPVPASGANGVADIGSVSQDASAILHVLSDDKALANADERGYARSWEGVSLRLTEEMQACFPSSGLELQDQTQEDKERLQRDLSNRLEALAGIIVAFGEYVPAANRTYMPPLLKHIRQQAPGSTLVPLELFVQTLHDLGMSHTAIQFPKGKHPLEGGGGGGSLEARVLEKLALEPPSNVAALRSQLDKARADVSTLQERLREEERAVEVISTKYAAAEGRVADGRVREEALLNKFTQLSRSLEALHRENDPEAQVSAGKMINVKDVGGLLDKLSGMQAEVATAEKRQYDAERRCEALLAECNTLKEVQLPALKLKCERKKSKNKDMAAKMVDLEAVSRSYYAELQVSLSANARYESDCSDLRVRMSQLERDRDTRDNAISQSSQNNNSSSMATAIMRGQLVDASKATQAEKDYHYQTKLALEQETFACNKLRTINEALRMQNDVKSHEIQQQNGQLRDASARIQALEAKLATAWASEKLLKRLTACLNDQICDLQGNIRVFCRVRAFGPDETVPAAEAVEEMVKFTGANKLEWNGEPYELDRVFSPEIGQEEIFGEVLPAVRTVIAGSRLCILAYGQTGSGKTHTMIGPEGDLEQAGVVVRSLESLFEMTLLVDTGVHCVLKLSMLEIHNDRIVDLIPHGASHNKAMAPGQVPPPAADLEVKAGRDGPYVDGLTSWPISSADEALAIIHRGHSNRKVAAQNIHERSSRSHLVIQVTCDRHVTSTGQRTRGQVSFVDLAGSERLKTTGASGQRLREAQHVNKNLQALGEVLSALATGAKHVPCRNSKLTFMLQESLTAEARVLLFVNLSLQPEYVAESAVSLTFAAKCRKAALKVDTK